jgi:hypothetical protein
VAPTVNPTCGDSIRLQYIETDASVGGGIACPEGDYQMGDQLLVRSSLLSHWSRNSSPFVM